ncbi:hypothetical protein [Acidiphilium angustum]|uniref:Uncharacterized protein n=2 Tax=Acidocellaceae TaxID=3385905 RepID=A0A8G2CJ16_ACIRU|nr:hypothetical protein [Acidiphilium angustum]SIQ40637.1 hypothetical protein SAMN05421828_104134 [Acidiphilium rubrum]
MGLGVVYRSKGVLIYRSLSHIMTKRPNSAGGFDGPAGRRGWGFGLRRRTVLVRPDRRNWDQTDDQVQPGLGAGDHERLSLRMAIPIMIALALICWWAIIELGMRIF